jgi:hypothetical protein
MKEDNKYYTPTLDEFHVGFEYEELVDNYPEDTKKWINVKVAKHEELEFIKDNLTTKVRVKYLDKDDIEELGWEYIGKLDAYIHKFEYNTDTTTNKVDNIMALRYEDNDTRIIIATNKYDHYRFVGTIKNKSELKRLMKQLNIIKNERTTES